MTQVVNANNTATSLTSSLNPSYYTQAVTFTATVSPSGTPLMGPPTGTVDFFADDILLGSGTLSAGVATLTVSYLDVGSHQITATYNGDNTFEESTSAPLTQTVNANHTTTTVSSSLNPSYYTQPVTFPATVSPSGTPLTGPPTGTVDFFADSIYLGSGTLSGGVTTLTVSDLDVGSHEITATYNGDITFAESTSAPLIQTVNANNTTTTLASSLNPSFYTQAVTFTATVSPSGTPLTGPPTGTVDFFADSSYLGSGTLSAGVATLTVSYLDVGSHDITAVYNGDGVFAESSSRSLIQTVNANNTTTSLSSSANPSTEGQAVTFTATVSPSGTPFTGPPTSTVDFYADFSYLGSGTLSGGVAHFTTSDLLAGSYEITATYNGDSIFAGSDSSPLDQTVLDGSGSR